MNRLMPSQQRFAAERSPACITMIAATMFGVDVGTKMSFTDEDLLAAIDGFSENFMHGLNVPFEIVQSIGRVRTLRAREPTANLLVGQG